MNDNIRDNAHKAGFRIKDGTAYLCHPTPTAAGLNRMLDNYAKQLIKECIDVASDAKSLEAAVMIKQHFGIK